MPVYLINRPRSDKPSTSKEDGVDKVYTNEVEISGVRNEVEQ